MVSDEHPENMDSIFDTPKVSKPDKSIELSTRHPLNMDSMLFILGAMNPSIFIVFSEEQLANSAGA